MDENFREEQDRQFDSESQTQEQTQTASEQTTEQMNMQNENSSYGQNYGSSNVYGQTGAEQNANAYNRQNAQSSMYHGTPGQNMYFGGAFYSSNQHAGYNSQTGYTSAYTNPSGNAAQGTGASTQNMNGYSENVNKAMQKAAEKEKKKSEKMVRSAKKKADKKAKKEMKKTNGGRSTGKKVATTIAAAVVFGLVAGCVFQGVRYGSDKFLKKENQTVQIGSDTTTSSALLDANASGSTGDYSVADVSATVMPSIVSITGTYVTTYQYWFDTYEQEQSGAGSGIIIGKDETSLYILTNYHVVKDAKELSAGFIDGESAGAEVKGYDESNDVAVVTVPLKKIKDDTLSQIKEITIGSSENLRAGDPCIAIGNALGYGQSVTVGYISALDREVSVDDGTVKVLQTDAAINPGNSGGALVDDEGKVIGINSAKYSDTSVEGMGFAIPISTAVPIINDIIDAQQVSEDKQAYLGIKGTDVSSEISQYYNMPEGIYVGKVTKDSPAGKAGIKTGDIIVKFNGNETTTMDGLKDRLGRCKAGDTVEVVVKRADNGDYKEVTMKVKLGKKSDSTDDQSNDSQSNDSQSGNSSQNGSQNNDGNQNGWGSFFN